MLSPRQKLTCNILMLPCHSTSLFHFLSQLSHHFLPQLLDCLSPLSPYSQTPLSTFLSLPQSLQFLSRHLTLVSLYFLTPFSPSFFPSLHFTSAYFQFSLATFTNNFLSIFSHYFLTLFSLLFLSTSNSSHLSSPSPLSHSTVSLFDLLLSHSTFSLYSLSIFTLYIYSAYFQIHQLLSQSTLSIFSLLPHSNFSL